jgi:toxin YoeB
LGRVREGVFRSECLSDLSYWVKTDRAAAIRIIDLIEAILRDPFQGIGKPEPLKFELKGCWSRRITREHRIVYLVERDRVVFLQARHHY